MLDKGGGYDRERSTSIRAIYESSSVRQIVEAVLVIIRASKERSRI